MNFRTRKILGISSPAEQTLQFSRNALRYTVGLVTSAVLLVIVFNRFFSYDDLFRLTVRTMYVIVIKTNCSTKHFCIITLMAGINDKDPSIWGLKHQIIYNKELHE